MKKFTPYLSSLMKRGKLFKNNFLFTLLVFLISSGSMFAQKPIDSLNFATNHQINTAVMNGESLFIGGDFGYVGKKIGPVAFFHDGSNTPDYKKPLFGEMVNSSFAYDYVETVCNDGNNGWFVGGYFKSTNNQEAFAKFIHIKSDNTLDPKLIIKWKTVRKVNVLKKDGDFLYVGGDFTALDNTGNEHKNVFRLNLSNYTIDAAWNPPIVNSNYVDKIEVGSDNVFLAGDIKKVDDFEQDAMVVVDKMTGARVTFPTISSVSAMHIIGDTLLLAEPDLYWSSYPDGCGYITKGVAVLDETNDSVSRYIANTDYYFLYTIPDGNDGWYAKGRFNGKDGIFHLSSKLEVIENFSQDKAYPGGHLAPMLLHNNSLFDADATSQEGWVDIGNTVKARRLFKLDATTGAFDTTFTPNPNGRIYSMVMQGDTLFVGGTFDSIAGKPRDGLAAINANTGALLDWHPEVHLSNYLAGFTGGVRYFYTLGIADGYLYTGGVFQMSTATLDGSGKGIYGLARFSLSNNELDTTFHIYTNYWHQPKVTEMAFYSGQLFFVGNFTINTSSGTVKDAGMIDLSTKVLQPVNPHLNFTGYSNQEPGILVHNNKLYFNNMEIKDTVSGAYRYITFSINTANRELTSWNPAPNNNVYSLSFSGDQLLMTGGFYFLHYNGGNDLTGINIKTKQYIQFPNISPVYSIVASDKYIYMGGNFTYYNDSVVNGLFRLKRSDLSLTPFKHQIKNNNGRASIGALSLGDNGLYVVGYYSSMFNLVQGNPRQNICLLDPENTSLKSWNPPPFNGRVFRVFAKGTDVALSGEFGLMPAYARNGLAKINLKTGSISDWNANITFSSYSPKIFKLLVAGDTLFVGAGSVSKVNTKDANNIFAVNTNSGSFFEGFAPPAPDDWVTSISKSGNNLYIGGNFEKIGNTNRYLIAKLDAANGTLKNWSAKLDPTNNWGGVINDILANDTNVFIAGNNLRIIDSAENAGLLRFDAAGATLKKMYGRNKYSTSFTSVAQNSTGKIAIGGPNKDIYGNNAHGFYLYDAATDSLIPKNTAPVFRSGVINIQALGDKFLVAGNQMKEFGSYTKKPGLFVYDPTEDTTISFFSTPVITGTINTFAANEKQLAFAGDFGGMNNSLRNTDLALMNTPELYLKPGVTSWSPHSANTADPFAVSVYGSGFTNQTTVFLYLSDKIVTPDSMSVSDRKLVAYFNGSDFSANSWNLKIQIAPGDTPLDFEKAIAIKKAEKTDVWVKWTGPNRVLASRPTTYYLTYGNKGDKDAYGVILYVAVGADQTVIFPHNITHPEVKIKVNWDTIPNYVDVDYFLGEPFHGKVYTLFFPYMPQQYNGAMKLKVTTGAGTHDVRVAIGKPIYQNYDELFQSLKSTHMAYNFFNCMYSVASMAVDLTPGLSCAKAAFDNSVLMAVDKYQKGESIKAEDIANSIGMTALGCVPGGAQMRTAFKIARGMASMYAGASGAGGAMTACGGFAKDCKKEFLDMMGYYSHDPNAKYGPSGRASSVFVSTHKDFQYMITYENDSAATAPAQRVIIIDTLDKNVFDIHSFRPVGFGFGDTAYFYQANDGDTVDIDMRPDKQIIVRVIHSLDETSGILTWTFLTLDPNTYELVENIDDGFLPPNKKSPEGEGNVVYTITPLSGLPDSTLINNSAHIVFDWNEEIPTNRWHNATDNTPPESAVKPLPEVTMDKSFKVHWGGKDQGSGIFSYTVFVAENDSAYYSWLPDTHDTVAVFTGKGGVTYKFYTVAVDSAGNAETAPATYDAITRVSGTGIDNFGVANELEIKIYPNPAKEKVTIESYLPAPGRMRIDVLNACGRMVTEPQNFTHVTGKSSLSFDLHGLPAGIYFVRILTKQGVQIKKLMKH